MLFVGLFAFVIVIWAVGLFLVNTTGAQLLLLGLGVVLIIALRAFVDWFCRQAREAISAS